MQWSAFGRKKQSQRRLVEARQPRGPGRDPLALTQQAHDRVAILPSTPAATNTGLHFFVLV